MTVWKQLDSAIAFAATAHAGQVRKYDGLPYITHPIAVMVILHETAAVVSEDQLVAAVLHDVVEDTPVSIETIERRFGSGVAALVFDLTDAFTHEAYPDLNRATRKDRERERLAAISGPAQDIKLADLIHNTASIAAHDPGFARTYLEEKRKILEVMVAGDRRLYDRALASLAWGQGELVQRALAA
jgi:(p)ppGpp synthase/HD superfamily hydrolase